MVEADTIGFFLPFIVSCSQLSCQICRVHKHISLYLNGVADGAGSYHKLAAGGAHDLMLAEEGNHGIELSNLSGHKPAWVSDVDLVERCLSDIGRTMTELQSMHAQRVGSVFGKDLEDMEHLIEKRTVEVTDRFRYAEGLLQKVGMATRRAGGQEAIVGANVQRRYEETEHDMLGYIITNKF